MSRWFMLGDHVKAALETVGITQERVEKWVGTCSCRERQIRLNNLGSWAARLLNKALGRDEALDRLTQMGVDTSQEPPAPEVPNPPEASPADPS